MADHPDRPDHPRHTDPTRVGDRADHLPEPEPTARSGRAPQRRDVLAFDRFDRWGLVVLLGAVALGAILAGVVEPLAGWATGAPLTPQVVSAVTVPPLDAAGVGYGEAAYAVDAVDPGAAQRLVALVPGILLAVLVVLSCWCIVLLLRTVASGDPFDPANVTRLRIIAGALVVGAPVGYLLQLVSDAVVLGGLDLGGLDLTFTLDIPWLPMVAGLVVAMLAEAFKAGSRLRDDVDGLV
ncbi:MAG: DUF2975 domain-containing protein [Ornithinibacter sp.]